MKRLSSQETNPRLVNDTIRDLQSLVDTKPGGALTVKTGTGQTIIDTSSGLKVNTSSGTSVIDTTGGKLVIKEGDGTTIVDTTTTGGLTLNTSAGNAVVTVTSTPEIYITRPTGQEQLVVGNTFGLFDFGTMNFPIFYFQNAPTAGVAGGAPAIVLQRTNIGAGGDVPGIIAFKEKNLSGTYKEFAKITSVADTLTAGAEVGRLALGITLAGADQTFQIQIRDGMIVGGPSGSFKGVGTLNVQNGVYLNGNGPLNDYQEGTWTPTLTTQGVNFTSVTYGNRNGFYRKVGNIVFVCCTLSTTAVTVGSATGNVVVAGLPFVQANSNYNTGLTVAFQTGWVTVAPNVGFIPNNSSQVQLEGSLSTATLQPANVSATQNWVYMSGCYPT